MLIMTFLNLMITSRTICWRNLVTINNNKVWQREKGDWQKKEAVESLNQAANTFRAFKSFLFLKIILKKQVKQAAARNNT